VLIAIANNKKFTVAEVVKFVEKSGNISSWFHFFETSAENSDFYLLLAKPILSLGTVGSIDIERRVKPPIVWSEGFSLLTCQEES
jgi:hypothetical protein